MVRAAHRRDPQSGLIESSLNIPTTAHILGGAVIGADPSSGVIDADCRAFGYENLLVCDGAAVPANPGVNPSLTITALAERAIVPQEGNPPRHPPGGGGGGVSRDERRWVGGAAEDAGRWGWRRSPMGGDHRPRRPAPPPWPPSGRSASRSRR